MAITIGDKNSALFTGLSGFWTRFFRDTADLEAFYQASEIYLGQAYLDLMAAVLNIGIEDTPVFNREAWKLFLIDETQVNYVEGASIAEDRYVLDAPSTIVSLDFLQNTIFSPDVLLERGVDFFVIDDDGYVRFIADPFQGYLDTNGEWLPLPGVAWRTIQKEVGNQFTDRERDVNWVDDTDAKRGDTLRLLGHRGVLLGTDVNGAITIGLGSAVFSDVGVGACKEGDILHVYQSVAPDTSMDGYYVVKSTLGPNQVLLEETLYLPVGPSTTALRWSLYRGMYFAPYRDYEVDYFDKLQIVGSSENPYPTDLNTPVVYAVVRTPADPEAVGVAIVPQPLIAPFAPVDLSYRHLVPGSLVVYAKTLAGGQVEVDVDYTVDYWRGILTPLTAWDPSSYFTCDFEFSEEVMFAAGGEISAKTVGRVKQLSLWAPEVLVDRMTLAFNYGSLLGSFEASSETYKALLRGVMALYVYGPVFERAESALNVCAGLPCVKNEGEILEGYFNGEDAADTNGVIVGATSYFATVSLGFTPLDIGGRIVVSGATHAVNNGAWKIASIIDSSTVELEASVTLVNEVGLTWVLSREYKKVVTTDQRTYEYAYNVPVRADVQYAGNFGHLSFGAFEPLTTAFQITDAVETPTWWHGKYIPATLWTDATSARRLASTQLVSHVIGPVDDARIGDPGLYVGADDAQSISAAPFRHMVGFILFSRYLCNHMFYLDIDEDLELDADFSASLRDVVLVSKPAWTQAYVEPGEVFTDSMELDDHFYGPDFTFFFGPEEEVEIIYNKLVIGDPNAPLCIGDYFRYIDMVGVNTGIVLPVDPTTPFTLPINLPPVLPEQRCLTLVINATVGGIPVREGLDYWVDWIAGGPGQFVVWPLTSWDAVFPILVDMVVLEIVNIGTTPVPDTRLGFTPISIGGANPGTIRTDDYSPFPTPANWYNLRTGFIDRAVSLWIDCDTGVPGGVPYVY